MTVLVTCGHTRAGLATTRALGRAGVAVAAGAPQRPALALWSRYATSTLLLPDAEQDARRFAAAVIEQVVSRQASCALAGTDAAIWALSRAREALSSSAQAVLPPHDAVVVCLDRTALHDRARALGVPVVPTHRIHDEGDVEPLLLRLQKSTPHHRRYNALVRPLVSSSHDDGTPKAVTAIPVESIGALRRLLYEHSDLQRGCLIEPRPDGRYLGYGAVCDHGEVHAEIFQERLRERGDLSGVSTLAQTIPVDAEVRERARTLLAGLSFHGPVLVEMLRGDDGVARLVNVIPRLWGSLGLSVSAGVNVPLLCVRLAEGDTSWQKAAHVSVPGKTWRWVVGDVEVMAQRLGRLLARVEGRGVIQRRAQSVFELLDVRDWVRARPDVFELDDPMPSVLELQQRLDETRTATRQRRRG